MGRLSAATFMNRKEALHRSDRHSSMIQLARSIVGDAIPLSRKSDSD